MCTLTAVEANDNHPLSLMSAGEGDADENLMTSPNLYRNPPLDGEDASRTREDWVMVDAPENQPHGVLIDPNVHAVQHGDMNNILNGALCGIPAILAAIGSTSTTGTSNADECPDHNMSGGCSGGLSGGFSCDSTGIPTRCSDPLEVSFSGSQISLQPKEQIPLDINRDDLVYSYPRLPIGHGAFGRVYKAQYHGHDVAVKQIGQELSGSKEIKSIIDELKVLSQLGPHRNVVRCFGGCMTRPHVFLVEELMESDLHRIIHPDGAGINSDVRPQPLPLRQTLDVGLDIVRGLEHMHPLFIHRDLKPHNILLKDGVAKIADFGLTRAKLNAYMSTETKGGDGTIQYMAPECMDSRSVPKSDIYSLGIILWECVTGLVPYRDLISKNPVCVIYHVFIKGGRPEFPDNVSCPSKLRDLIHECWSPDPKERPECQEVIARLESIKRSFCGTAAYTG